MIIVNVIRDNDKIKSLTMSGHSGYDEIGRDVVCASCSSLLIHTINLLEEFKCDFEYIQNEEEPLISIVIKTYSDTSDILMNVLVKDLNDVSEGYKKFIKIKENRR
ncbi:MAG: ribosomal-processing cysteine protease Prp [Bacilli bacterium]|jgi:hypothetical protein|nr:ribosomal-processing cysteine protease Prp [Bacilli bacterium]